MALLRGNQVKLFMTCEHNTAAVDLSGDTAVAGISTTDFGIGQAAGSALEGVGNRGDVSNASAVNHRFKFVQAVEVNKGWDSEDLTIFGYEQEYVIPQRRRWEVNITVRSQDKRLSKLIHGARYGPSSSAVLYTGYEGIYSNDVGYRLYIFVDDDTKAEVFYHGVIPDDGYTVEFDAQKTMIETIKLVGNNWSASVATTSMGATCPIV